MAEPPPVSKGWPHLREKAGHLLRQLVPSGGLAIVLLATLLKGILWSATIPLEQGPDEPSHVALVQFIAEQHRLPKAEEVYRADELTVMRRLAESNVIEGQRDARQTFSSTQTGPNEAAILALDPSLRTSFETKAYVTAMFVPPLYHWLASLPYRLLGSADVLARVFSMRLVSVLLTVALVWVSYWVARESFPENRLVRETVPIVVSFQPMVTFVGAVVNPDILLLLLLAVATCLVMRALRRGVTWRVTVGLGIVTGLGLLTKPTVLGYGLGLAIVYLVHLFKRTQPWWRLAAHGFLLLVIALAMSGWFLVRNAEIQGSALYANPYEDRGIMATVTPQPDLTPVDYWRQAFRDVLWNRTFRSFWGLFGWLDTPMSGGVYDGIRWISILALVGVGLYTVVVLQRRPVDWSTLWVLLILLLSSWSLLVPMFGRSYELARQVGMFGSTSQGRYLLGMWAAQATLLVFGLTALVRQEAQRLAHGLVCCAMIGLQVYAFVAVLIPRYYL